MKIFKTYVFKVYTVGDEYAHAEARKSPVLDGKVDRTADGKEIRYPVILSPFEKMVAFKVCRAFKVGHLYRASFFPHFFSLLFFS